MSTRYFWLIRRVVVVNIDDVLYTNYKEREHLLILESNNGSIVIDITGEMYEDEICYDISLDYDGIRDSARLLVKHDETGIIQYKNSIGNMTDIIVDSNGVVTTEDFNLICTDPTYAIVKIDNTTVLNVNWMSFCTEVHGTGIEDRCETCTYLIMSILMTLLKSSFKTNRNSLLNDFIQSLQ